MARNTHKIGLSRGDIVYKWVVYAVLALLTLIVAYPLYFVVIASFSDPTMVTTGKVVLLPHGITFGGYKTTLEYGDIWVGYRNTIIYTVLGTLLALVVTIPAAYSLSRKDLAGKKLYVLFFTISMFFGGGLVPTYMTIKGYGLLNTPHLMIILGCISVYNMIVCRTFFQTNIPDEMLEAARIDGCGNFRFFTSIVLPLSKAIIAVMIIYYASGKWNSYFSAMIYLTNRNLVPLQLVLKELLTAQATIMQEMANGFSAGDEMDELIKTVEAIKYCVVIVSSVPMLCAYPFAQRYFMQGVMMGAIKG